jgi:hypothetical protein
MSKDFIDQALLDVHDLSLDELRHVIGEAGISGALDRILATDPSQSTGFQSSI